MKKKLPVIILALTLLYACGNAGNTPSTAPEPEHPPLVTAALAPESTPESFHFTHEGYVSIMDIDAPTKSAPVVGTRRYEQYTDHLIVSDDYGRLIPYAGQRLADGWPASTGCLYGLMTADGEVVVDPVYSNVEAPDYYDDGSVLQRHPLLVMRRSDPEAQSGSNNLIALAAADGSWCTDFAWREYTASADGLVLIGDETMTLMCPDGSIERELTREGIGVSEDDWQNMLYNLYWHKGMYGSRRGDCIVISVEHKNNGRYYRCYDLSTGQFTDIYIYAFWDMGGRATMIFNEYVQPTIPDTIPWPDQLWGWDAPYLLELYEETGKDTYIYTYYNSDGTPLPGLARTIQGNDYNYPFTRLVGGLVEQLELNYASYYNLETGECIFRICLNYEAD